MKVLNEDHTFNGGVRFGHVPLIATDTLKNSVTPNVADREKFICSGATVTVTNFIGGVDGQAISLLGDGTTTIVNNANIVTNTGANKLLTVNKIYRFTYFNTKKKWYEDA